MNSPTGPGRRRCSGRIGSTSTSEDSIRISAVRARMTSLRTTSLRPRSSLGSGSEIPLCRASSTAELNRRPRCSSSIRKVRVPDSVPSREVTVSPLRASSAMLRTIGRPAPTVVPLWRPPARAARRMSVACSSIGPERGILFAVTTAAPARRYSAYLAETAALAVQSTTTSGSPVQTASKA